MNKVVHCPGCGFRGRLPESLNTLKSIVCPSCKTVVALDQLAKPETLLPDESIPIWVDSGPAARALVVAGTRRAPEPVEEPEPTRAGPSLEMSVAPSSAETHVERPAETHLERPPETRIEKPTEPRSETRPETRAMPTPSSNGVEYTGAYMMEEATRFAKYVNARLADLHKRRQELANAESTFETTYMARKQELHQFQVALAARVEELEKQEAGLGEERAKKQADFETKEATVAVREAALVTREAEVTARETRVARAARQSADIDRRTAELKATLEQLDARRVTLAEEREALNRRAEGLDRAELTLHRREAELDELDERLRQEQEEWEREREQAHGRVG